MALLNTGAVNDPLITGVDHLFQIIVCKQAGRNVGTKSAYLCPDEGLQIESPNAAPGCHRFSPDKKAGGDYQTPGRPLHTHEPVTVASFRTWRDWRDCVACDPMPPLLYPSG